MIANGTEANSAYAPVGATDVYRDRSPHPPGEVTGAERERLASGFGALLKQARAEAGLSQTQLGSLAGFSPHSLSRLERGTRRPTGDGLSVIVEVLAPGVDRPALSESLRAAAGSSMREGSARRKRRIDNKHRREALADLDAVAKRGRRKIRSQEDRGILVSGSLRKMTERLEAIVERRKQDLENHLTAQAGSTNRRRPKNE